MCSMDNNEGVIRLKSIWELLLVMKKRSFSIVVYFYNISFSVINSTIKYHAKVSCCIVCDNIGCAFINKKFKDFIVMKHDEHHICDAGRVETIVGTLD